MDLGNIQRTGNARNQGAQVGRKHELDGSIQNGIVSSITAADPDDFFRYKRACRGQPPNRMRPFVVTGAQARAGRNAGISKLRKSQ